MPNFTPAQLAALSAFKVSPDQLARFEAGISIACKLSTQSDEGIAVLQKVADRMRCGIFFLHDQGGGLVTLVRFRSNAMTLAREFDKEQVEVFGATVLNKKLEALLRRQGFTHASDEIPAELGGGSWPILSKTIPV